MKLFVTTLFLTLAILKAPAFAGTLSLDVSGVLGPDLQGIDPLNMVGLTFSASGAINPNAAPIFVTGDSATYDFSEDLQVTLSKLTLTGYDATLTITAPPSGADTMIVEFDVDEFGFTPEVVASFSLPAGTLNGTEIQKVWAQVTQPDSKLSFGIPDAEDTLSGTVGLTGTISLGGTPPASVPEPGTFGLLGAGLVLAAAHNRRAGNSAPSRLSAGRR
ncbi:MAG: PEP-CTERM sorting domain-containing protein [Bryobacteraceae bacterium]|jgi:PEP-CTERM motif-containing protein